MSTIAAPLRSGPGRIASSVVRTAPHCHSLCARSAFVTEKAHCLRGVCAVPPAQTRRARVKFMSVTSRPAPLHVVGIGASAGGLEALERFFQELPTDTGMAFVVVQHLSPDF